MKPFLVILFLFCLSSWSPPSNCQSPVWWESVLEKTQKLIELKYRADNRAIYKNNADPRMYILNEKSKTSLREIFKVLNKNPEYSNIKSPEIIFLIVRIYTNGKATHNIRYADPRALDEMLDANKPRLDFENIKIIFESALPYLLSEETKRSGYYNQLARLTEFIDMNEFIRENREEIDSEEFKRIFSPEIVPALIEIRKSLYKRLRPDFTNKNTYDLNIMIDEFIRDQWLEFVGPWDAKQTIANAQSEFDQFVKDRNRLVDATQKLQWFTKNLTGEEFEIPKALTGKFSLFANLEEIDTPSEQLEINQSANKSIPNKPIDFLSLLCRSVFL